jgi:hypothetical protein
MDTSRDTWKDHVMSHVKCGAARTRRMFWTREVLRPRYETVRYSSEPLLRYGGAEVRNRSVLRHCTDSGYRPKPCAGASEVGPLGKVDNS